MFCSHEGIFPLRYWDFSLRQLIPSGYALSYFSSIQNWYDAFLNYLYKSLHMSTYVFTSQECAEIGGGGRDRYLS